MTTTPINSVARSGNQIKSTKFELKTDDFIKMMVTQLQNQDPLEPAKNQELLQQMSQIGQLQSNSQMQDLLKGLALQNQIGSAGNLIGKMVSGIDESNDPIEGLVTAVRVEKDGVRLELDNGKTLPLGNVTSIAAPTAATATAPVSAS